MPNLITTVQFAALLGVDRSTIVRRVRAGSITPAYSAPGRTGIYLFDPETVDQVEVGEE